MDWKTYYQERHLTADEAVKHIKSGNYAAGCSAGIRNTSR